MGEVFSPIVSIGWAGRLTKARRTLGPVSPDKFGGYLIWFELVEENRLHTGTMYGKQLSVCLSSDREISYDCRRWEEQGENEVDNRGDETADWRNTAEDGEDEKQ